MRRLIAVSIASLLTGCAFFPDFETSPVYRAPISEVVNQIRCDLSEFLKWHKANITNPNFSLDEKSYATMELSLSTTAYGDAKFSRIDTIRLGASGFLAVGGGNQPFPTLGVKQLNQTVAKVTVNVSQDSDLLSDACAYGYGQVFSSEPHADRVLINDMRVGEWLKRSFESAQRIKSQGPVCDMRPTKGTPSNACSVSLETAVLTTKFQLIGDVSGGLLDMAKLVPVISTPTLQLNADYYHQITIIFSGNNSVAQVAAARGKGGVVPYRLDPPKGESREVDPVGADIIRQLRSIRDATILSAPPR